MKNPSQEQLSNSLDRRIKHLMIKTLEKFETMFPQLDNSRDTNIFKGDIRTSFNDVIRAQRDELRDYEITYRPLRMNDDNTLSITRTFMDTVQKIEFSLNSEPSIMIYASPDKKSVLEAIRTEFGTGVLYEETGYMILEIVGTLSCINCVLPIMDRYSLHTGVRPKYQEWRREVVKLYRSKV